MRLEASQGNLGRTAAGMVYNVCDVRVALILMPLFVKGIRWLKRSACSTEHVQTKWIQCIKGAPCCPCHWPHSTIDAQDQVWCQKSMVIEFQYIPIEFQWRKCCPMCPNFINIRWGFLESIEMQWHFKLQSSGWRSTKSVWVSDGSVRWKPGCLAFKKEHAKRC